MFCAGGERATRRVIGLGFGGAALMGALLVWVTPVTDPVYVDSGAPGVSVDGRSVGGLYLYDPQGRPLTGVRVYDDAGNPVVVSPPVVVGDGPTRPVDVYADHGDDNFGTFRDDPLRTTLGRCRSTSRPRRTTASWAGSPRRCRRSCATWPVCPPAPGRSTWAAAPAS